MINIVGLGLVHPYQSDHPEQVRVSPNHLGALHQLSRPAPLVHINWSTESFVFLAWVQRFHSITAKRPVSQDSTHYCTCYYKPHSCYKLLAPIKCIQCGMHLINIPPSLKCELLQVVTCEQSCRSTQSNFRFNLGSPNLIQLNHDTLHYTLSHRYSHKLTLHSVSTTENPIWLCWGHTTAHAWQAPQGSTLHPSGTS